MDDRRKVARCGGTDVWVWQADITAGSATAVALRLAAADGLTSVVPPIPVATVVFALYDRDALERFGAALERELGRGGR